MAYMVVASQSGPIVPRAGRRRNALAACDRVALPSWRGRGSIPIGGTLDAGFTSLRAVDEFLVRAVLVRNAYPLRSDLLLPKKLSEFLLVFRGDNPTVAALGRCRDAEPVRGSSPPMGNSPFLATPPLQRGFDSPDDVVSLEVVHVVRSQ